MSAPQLRDAHSAATDDPDAVAATPPPAQPLWRSAIGWLGAILIAAGLGAVGALLPLGATYVVTLPAFGGSHILLSLSAATVTGSAIIMVVLLWWARTPHAAARPALRRLIGPATQLFTGVLVGGALAIPLGATKLYLGGISIDQAFRTQYLTRLTDSVVPHDIAYIDTAPFYPAGWFYPAAQLARLAGVSGWVVFKPWAVISLAIVAAVAVLVWQRLIGLHRGTAVGLAITLVMLIDGAHEPYGAIVAMGLPALWWITPRALSHPKLLNLPLLGGLVFLGVSATMYTLYTAVGALTVVVAAVILAVRHRSLQPLFRLALMGTGAVLIALTFWLPYLIAVLTTETDRSGQATHYLPEIGAQLPLPFFEPTPLAVLSAAGVLWLVIIGYRQAWAVTTGVVVMYVWALASMVAPLLGNTLLGFRMYTPLAIVFAAFGTLWLTDLYLGWMRHRAAHRTTDTTLTPERMRLGAAVVAVAAIVGTAQAVPLHNEDYIRMAYTDTDGAGERGDRYPGSSAVWFHDVDAAIRAVRGDNRAETVVLSDDQAFGAYYSYYQFQAMTSHYANPLGQYQQRMDFLRTLTEAETPEEFAQLAESSPWRMPDVYVFRGDLEDESWTFSAAEDIYPSEPNVRFVPMTFPAAAFAGMEQQQVGPFVLVFATA